MSAFDGRPTWWRGAAGRRVVAVAALAATLTVGVGAPGASAVGSDGQGAPAVASDGQGAPAVASDGQAGPAAAPARGTSEQRLLQAGVDDDTTMFNATVADAAGELVTTPTDLARFWQALQRGQLLKPRQMDQLHETVLADTFQDVYSGGRYGLGIIFIPNRCGGSWGTAATCPAAAPSTGCPPTATASSCSR